MALRKIVQTIHKQYLTPALFLFHVFIPILTLLLLLLIVSWLFPPGVNKAFATRTVPYLIPVVTLAGLILLGLGVLRKNKINRAVNSQEDFNPLDLILLLFPLTPIVQYILNNISLLSWKDGLVVLGLFTLIVSFPVLFLPLLFRKTAAFESVRAIGVAFTFLIMNMASLSNQFSWHTSGSLRVIWPLLGLLGSVLWLAFQFRQKRLVCLFIVVLFVLNTVVPAVASRETISTTRDSNSAESKNPLLQLVNGRTPDRLPSIYLLVYDSYPAADAINAYGLNNQDQEQYLREQGFKIYPRTYSVAAHTLPSISFMLNSAVEYMEA